MVPCAAGGACAGAGLAQAAAHDFVHPPWPTPRLRDSPAAISVTVPDLTISRSGVLFSRLSTLGAWVPRLRWNPQRGSAQLATANWGQTWVDLAAAASSQPSLQGLAAAARRHLALRGRAATGKYH